VLEFTGDTEGSEDEDYDEKVVHTEHELHEVAGGELQTGLRTHIVVDSSVEGDGGADEECHLQERLPRPYDMGLAVEHP